MPNWIRYSGYLTGIALIAFIVQLIKSLGELVTITRKDAQNLYEANKEIKDSNE
jgi:hypothetical protein